MATFHVAMRTPRPWLPSRSIASIPDFLLPAAARASFSTSSSSQMPRGKRQRDRGVSALRSSGVPKREKLSVRLADIPRPVPLTTERQRELLAIDPDHGLWQFFRSKDAPVAPPAEIAEHGREWTMVELRSRNWDTLWKLWWACVRELNILQTELMEYERLKLGYGKYEINQRKSAVKMTMKSIRSTLLERYDTWSDAHAHVTLGRDPSIKPGQVKDGLAFVYDETLDQDIPLEEEDVNDEVVEEEEEDEVEAGEHVRQPRRQASAAGDQELVGRGTPVKMQPVRLDSRPEETRPRA